MVTMDKKSMKNQFKIIQKLLGNIFDNKDIIFHHSDHLKAKVEWDVPVQVITHQIGQIAHLLPHREYVIPI